MYIQILNNKFFWPWKHDQRLHVYVAESIPKPPYLRKNWPVHSSIPKDTLLQSVTQPQIIVMLKRAIPFEIY